MRLLSLLPRELAAIPDPKPVWRSASSPSMPDPWPVWEVHSHAGTAAEIRPLPCPRCGGPALSGHTCPNTDATSSQARPEVADNPAPTQ